MTAVYVALPVVISGFLIFLLIFLFNKFIGFLEKKFPDKVRRVPPEELIQRKNLFNKSKTLFSGNSFYDTTNPANPGYD